MTGIKSTHKTTDGREFVDLERAQEHQNLLDHINQHLDNYGVGESRRAKLTRILVDWHSQCGGKPFTQGPTPHAPGGES